MLMLNKMKIFAEMVKLEHTIFALPFAYIATFLAEGKILLDYNFLWITLAMVGARTTAMACNRIIDRSIDARNPRTRNRALPSGKMRAGEAAGCAVLFALLFFLSAYQLSPLAFKFSPVCLLAFIFYSYTKRFTWLCHACLGLTIGLAPFSAWIAITDSVSPGIIFLSLGVAFWVAGFDIIYACDDFEYDRREGLFSIPARFGLEAALRIASLVHAGATVFFFLTGWSLHLGVWYWLGLLVAVLLMYKQHSLMSAQNLLHLKFAFFHLNGILSITMLIAILVDIGAR